MATNTVLLQDEDKDQLWLKMKDLIVYVDRFC